MAADWTAVVLQKHNVRWFTRWGRATAHFVLTAPHPSLAGASFAAVPQPCHPTLYTGVTLGKLADWTAFPHWHHLEFTGAVQRQAVLGEVFTLWNQNARHSVAGAALTAPCWVHPGGAWSDQDAAVYHTILLAAHTAAFQVHVGVITVTHCLPAGELSVNACAVSTAVFVGLSVGDEFSSPHA